MVAEVVVAGGDRAVVPSRVGKDPDNLLSARARGPAPPGVVVLLACFVCACTLEPRVACAQSSSDRRTDVKGAIGDSFKLLAIEHAIRISFQEKTRKALGGPFLHDYRQSVRLPKQWQDTD